MNEVASAHCSQGSHWYLPVAKIIRCLSDFFIDFRDGSRKQKPPRAATRDGFACDRAGLDQPAAFARPSFGAVRAASAAIGSGLTFSALTTASKSVSSARAMKRRALLLGAVVSIR